MEAVLAAIAAELEMARSAAAEAEQLVRSLEELHAHAERLRPDGSPAPKRVRDLVPEPEPEPEPEPRPRAACTPPSKPHPNDDPRQKLKREILELLKSGPKSRGALAAATGAPNGRLTAALGELSARSLIIAHGQTTARRWMLWDDAARGVTGRAARPLEPLERGGEDFPPPPAGRRP